jgi:uncharacterized protein (TIGR02466 family)
MNIHSLFPTLVIDNKNANHIEDKHIFLGSIFNHMTADGRSSEATGHVDLHTDPVFNQLFQFIAENVKQYVAALNIDPAIFDYVLVKSWLNLIKDSDNPVHDHGDAHVSFAYYLNIPPGVDKHFVVYRPHETNSLYRGMHNFNITEYNPFNSTTWRIQPEEGKVIVFPSVLKHNVMPIERNEPIPIVEPGCESLEELLQHRICVAGDFILVHKNKTSQYLGLQPIQNWRAF